MKPKRSFMTKDFAISKESHSEGWTMRECEKKSVKNNPPMIEYK